MSAHDVPQKDLKLLEVLALKKAKGVLRSLSYPALPAARRPKQTSAQAVPKLAPKPSIGTSGRLGKNSAPLPEVLAAVGPHVSSLRKAAVEARRPVATDWMHLLKDFDGGDLRNVDCEGLMRNIPERQARVNICAQKPPEPKMDRSATRLSFSTAMGSFATEMIRPQKEEHWADLSTFENFHTPSGLVCVPQTPPQRLAPLPEPLPTIASLEIADDSDLWLQLPKPRFGTQNAFMQPRRQPGGVLEAGLAYVQACRRLGVKQMVPTPVFGQEVVLQGGGVGGTKHSLAIAEALLCCGPKRLSCRGNFFTDVGADKVLAAAFKGGRLERLGLVGSPLSYLSCVALHNCLRTRSGTSLVVLSIADCGLGGDLDEDFHSLPAEAASVYEHALFRLTPPEPPQLPPLELEEGEEPPPPEEAKEEELLPPPVPIAAPLFAQLGEPTCSLRVVNLSCTILSQAAVAALSTSLATSLLESLQLDDCGLGDEALDILATGITTNRYLLRLSLRRNCLEGSPSSGLNLVEAAGRHARLAHLDIAENVLALEIMKELGPALQHSVSLVAVHLLGGGTTTSGPDWQQILEECRVLVGAQHGKSRKPFVYDEDDMGEEELILCRTLYVEGLKKWQVVSPPEPVPPAPKTSRPPQGPEPELESWMPPCCWVCCHCEAVEYTWTVPDRGPGDDTGYEGTQMFVRPSFAAFQLIRLHRHRTAGAKRVRYSAKVLVPPGQHSHVFEARVPGAPTRLFWSASEPHAMLSQCGLSAEEECCLLAASLRARCPTGELNTLSISRHEDFEIPEDFRPVVPLPPEPDVWAEDPWRQQRLDQCFQVDKQQMRWQVLIHQDQEEETKKTLLKVYNHYYEAYAVTSGRSQWPLVRQAEVYTFFSESDLMGSDSEPWKLRIPDLQQMMLQTVAWQDPQQTKNPKDRKAQRAAEVAQKARASAHLTRPQFMELLLRFAICFGPKELSAQEAVVHFAIIVLCGRVLLPPLSPFPRGLALRVGRYADTLLFHRKEIRTAWERFGFSEGAFQALPQLLHMCDHAFTAKHVASIFALARAPVPDFNLAADLGTQSPVSQGGLRYEEFCEALGRLAMTWQQPGHQTETPEFQVGEAVNERQLAKCLERFVTALWERMRTPEPV